MITDTTFLIDLMVNKNEAVSKAKDHEGRGIPIVVGAPSIFELHVGVSHSKKSEEERSKIISTVDSLPKLPLDYKSARLAGEIYTARQRIGSTIDPKDAMLAGDSKIMWTSIITRNIKHFSNIAGVTVESY
ncbi:MAG TPA: PIN domain-containing protein [Nitrososphaerales archaeon]|nr:PIN domain-containing protein [Nitrososphaerales archaeon]